MVTTKRHKKTTKVHKTAAVREKRGLQTECQMTAKTIKVTSNKETQNDYKDTYSNCKVTARCLMSVKEY